jgi:DNA-binding NtrC family response regulator
VDVSAQWSNGVGGQIPPADNKGVYRLGEMIARSLVMHRLFSRLRRAAPHVRIVAFEGEAGTGKMLAAQTLHALGAASSAAFVPCVASRFISTDVQGLLEEARGGTLFLTRVDYLTPEQQSRLFDFLKWWEHRKARDTDGFLPRQIFFSSLQPLRQLSVNGRMRSDLSFYLTAIRFVLPPLRERREDIAVLAEHFAVAHGAAYGKQMRGPNPAALQRLISHNWPGNVRELESVISKAVMECEGLWICPTHIRGLTPVPVQQVHQSVPVVSVASEMKREADDDPNLDRMILRHIKAVLTKTGGNKLRAAQLLGISRSTLYRLLETGI